MGDWTGTSGVRMQVELVAGRDRRIFQADGRILEARSAYFRSMLSGGMREASDAAPIDLDEDVLRLAKFALEVHMLADRFLLPRLARLCEVFLSDFALRASIVLPMLASITSPRRPSLGNLEAACWEFLKEHWKHIVQ